MLPPGESAQLFAGENFEQYLNQLQTEGDYDYVLVDTSPISLTSESMLMVPTVQNALFVTKPGQSDRHSVMDSLEQLRLHKANILGLILNGTDASSNGYRYGYVSQSQKTFTANQAVAAYESLN